ncbi:MAG: hypothetical protein A3D31_01580 [Candidatus Fluviicola riflensis]|nr:MAG: hypothetical protein CHH17_03960 [Candidatus Fluviicola riflensis]OGS76292.1 MAG: hypothetical protein A3D31_01580 [Candidatus Fluviicola riflensis]OGS83164.1 MAG: hypothetical protein A2724_00260 [Fluviicola sp. RIFCSPHIGHO2_01_FULL_43_53]OGS83824.1 MAG: hypothetical protein A3E30_18185 [Fluviicola sp. RIFCSPHIGHO2_12_FULL_43_24]
MSKRLLLLILGLFFGSMTFGQSGDSSILLPNRLAIRSISAAKNQLILDTGSILTIHFIDFRDSLIRQQQRNGIGKLIGYSDSTIVLELHQEHVLTYWYNGTIDDSHYWKSEDSLAIPRIITIPFSEIHTIQLNRTTYKQVVGILQSTAYLNMIGNMVVLAVAFIVPKKNKSLVSGKNLVISTGIALGAGGASFFFYPKTYRLKNQPYKRRNIKWKLEVV